MGKPLPAGVGTNPAPASGDQANQVLTGTFAAIGPGKSACFWGSFNVAIWGTAVTTLTTTQGTLAATVASATGLAVGQTINGANVPPGTTIGVLAGTNVTLALPPGLTSAAVVTGADAAAIFDGVTMSATVSLERSFDGGSTWITCGVGGAGVAATYVFPTVANPVSVVVAEPERQVAYRLNCTAYTSGTVNYRISATGLAATVWGPNVG